MIILKQCDKNSLPILERGSIRSLMLGLFYCARANLYAVNTPNISGALIYRSKIYMQKPY